MTASLLLPAGINAAPMLEVSGAPAEIGDAIEISLVDTVADFQAADIAIGFDPTVISFVGLVAGTLTPGFFISANEVAAGDVNASLFGFPPASGSGSLVTVVFQAVSPGSSPVSFVDRFPVEPGLYNFDPLEVSLTVQTVTAVPLPPVLAIFALALCGLAGCRLPSRQAKPTGPASKSSLSGS